MSGKVFDELSSSFDPEILPVYTCIRELYQICDDYISDHGCMQWRFSPANPSMVKLQQILKSFQHHEVNFFYHTDPPSLWRRFRNIRRGLYVASLGKNV